MKNKNSKKYSGRITHTGRNGRNTPKFYLMWNKGLSCIGTRFSIHSGRNGTEYTTMVWMERVEERRGEDSQNILKIDTLCKPPPLFSSPLSSSQTYLTEGKVSKKKEFMECSNFQYIPVIFFSPLIYSPFIFPYLNIGLESNYPIPSFIYTINRILFFKIVQCDEVNSKK